MKLLYFDDYKLGVLKGDRVVDVSSVVRDVPHTGPGDLINGLIARFRPIPREARGCRGDAARASRCHRVRGAPAAVPSPPTSTRWRSTTWRTARSSAPAPINAFQKTANAICGPGDTMVLSRCAGDDLRGRGLNSRVI